MLLDEATLKKKFVSCVAGARNCGQLSGRKKKKIRFFFFWGGGGGGGKKMMKS